MIIKGWVRTSLIDFSEHIATVLFTAGCNFRCPMCHNADLVLHPTHMETLPEEELWAFLERRQGMVDGVVLTGGEPTLQPDLIPFIRRLQAQHLAVKLDTNGYRPDVLGDLLEEGLVDYVAIDIKAPPEKYPMLAGLDEVDVTRIARSIALLQESDVAHEFRTTVVPGMLDEDDIETIARQIEGAPQYTLQQFQVVNTLDPTLEEVPPYPIARLQTMAERSARWVTRVDIRGG